MFLMAIEIVNGWLAFTVPKFLGKVNLADGMLSTEGIIPMGAGLQEPVATCLPSVMGCLVVAQKLIKLLVDVKEATWPAAGVS